jgi:membrane-associated phospholipid phosphatase
MDHEPASALLRDRVRGTVLLLAATAVASGRVVIAVHYPSDVLAGALLGCAAAGICWLGPLWRLSDSAADRAGDYLQRVRFVVRNSVGHA